VWRAVHYRLEFGGKMVRVAPVQQRESAAVAVDNLA
jgi:hypothetical protein